MSNHSHNDNHGTGHDQELVESSGIQAKPILVFLAVLAAATALVFVIIEGLLYGFAKVDQMNPTQPVSQVESGRRLPPEPRLQGAPEPVPGKPGETRASQLPLDEMKSYKEQINEKAAGYAWVDQQGGIAQIPIEDAKKLIAKRGLPLRSETAIAEDQAAATVRKEVLNSESNGGRGIKSLKVATAPQSNAAPAAAAGETKPASDAQKPVAKPAATPKAAAAKK